MIALLSTVLNKTVVVDSDWPFFDDLCGSHLQIQSELHHVSWWYNSGWRLVMSLVRFDPSIFTVKQSLIVSQTGSRPVVLSWLVFLIPPISHLYGAGNRWLPFSSVFFLS